MNLAKRAPVNSRGIWLLAALVALAVVFSLLAVDRAQALVYWTEPAGGIGKIGRADLNGGNRNASFITGIGVPYDVVTTDKHVYWTNVATGNIGRANIDGTGVNHNFILGGSLPWGITVSAGRLYWTNSGSNRIARSNLNGSGLDQQFIDAGGGNGPRSVAVTGSHVFWSNFNGNSIGRSNLNGSDVNSDFLLGGGVNAPQGMAVAGNNLFWSNGDTTVGRVTTAGANLQAAFIGGGANPRDVSVIGGKLYWTRYEAKEIGRANVNGTGVQNGFMKNLNFPWGLHVDAIPTSANAYKFGKVKANRRKGTAKLAVKLKSPGKVTVTGRGVRKAGKTLKKPGGGTLKINIRAKSAAARKLKRTGQVKVKVKVAFKSTTNRKIRRKTKNVTLKLKR